MDTDQPDDANREFARELFSRHRDDIPRDVVPPTGLTREVLRRQNDAVGKPYEVIEPGELLTDVDGNPIGVGEPKVQQGVFGGVFISQAEADRLNVTPEEFPNVKIWKGNR